MFCKVCGKELLEGALFCGNCGSKVEPALEEETKEIPVDEEVTDMKPAEDPTIRLEYEEPTPAEKPTPAVESTPVVEPTPAEKPTPAVEPTPFVGSVPVVAATDKKAVKQEEKAIKAKIKEAKAAAKAERKRYMVKKNPVISSVVCVFLSIVTTAVMFMTAGISVLLNDEFNEFYYEFVLENFADFDIFWTLTSVWYLYAVATVLVLLVLLMLSLIKRRKYAIFNYTGIPMIVNGMVFAFIALLNEWIANTFDLPELFEKLIEAVGEARNTVLFAGVIMLAAGVLFVFVYVLTSAIHKTVYRKKCVKEECNQ